MDKKIEQGGALKARSSTSSLYGRKYLRSGRNQGSKEKKEHKWRGCEFGETDSIGKTLNRIARGLTERRSSKIAGLGKPERLSSSKVPRSSGTQEKIIATSIKKKALKRRKEKE